MVKEITKTDLLAERIKGMERALKLQAKEYKRRLTVLNGEGDRIKEILKESVPREVFDRTVNELNSRIQILTNFKNAQDGKTELTKWVPWAIAVLFGVLAYYKK